MYDLARVPAGPAMLAAITRRIESLGARYALLIAAALLAGLAVWLAGPGQASAPGTTALGRAMLPR